MINFTFLALTTLGSLLAWQMLTLAPPVLETNNQRTEVQALFEDLSQQGLIGVKADARFDLTKPDQALMAAWLGTPMNTQAQTLLTDLYATAAGNALRGQIALWNSSRYIAAIRDNSINQGVTHGGWRAYGCGDSSMISTAAPIAEAFGYVHQGRLRTGFGAWNAVAANVGCIEWRGQFQAPHALAMEILHIGQILGIPGQKYPGKIDNYDPPRALKLPDCINTSKNITAGQVGSWQIPPSAWHQIGPNAAQLTVRLRVIPAKNPSLASEGLQVGINRTDCQPKWQQAILTKARNKQSTPAIWHIETADKIPLANENLAPSIQAQELGLVPLVGFGVNDISGLARRMQMASPGGRLTLTIDSRLQAKARAALNAGLKKVPTKESWTTQRRAALVLLDANGGILAAVGSPEPPPLTQVTTWDLAAFAKVYPINNPMLVRAWAEPDRHQAAGSTFKPVTALAALTAAAINPDVANMLSGLSSKAFQDLTGLSLNAKRIFPYHNVVDASNKDKHLSINNFKSQTLRSMLRKKWRAKSCKGQTAAYDLSLTSAVRDSVNIWFVALAMLLDGDAADRYQIDPSPLKQRLVPELHLMKMLRKLGFGTTYPLFFDGVAKDIGKGRLYISADRIDILGKTPTPLRWILAQTAIGQGALVTPLRMASLAATLATKNVVQPHLDKAWNGAPIASKIFQILDIDTELLKLGMQGVVQSGTAHTAFLKMPAAIRCHTYAKTGTAQVAKRDGSHRLEPYVSAWTIGWHESPAKPPLAFACMVTHVDRKYGTGGQVCGPIIANLLHSIATL